MARREAWQWEAVAPRVSTLGRSLVGGYGPVLISVTAERPSATNFQRLAEVGSKMRESHPDGVYLLIVREHIDDLRGGEPLPGDARSAARRLLERFRGDLRGVAYVYEGSGFGASLVRMSFSALTRVLPVPARITADVPGALDWMGADAAVGWDRDGLLREVRSLRARLRESTRALGDP
ncbi:MAG: hypothetical protein RLO52_37325 [Sandaracinaceae bacterium]|nr:MAG: hypothetical protein EVA89_02255 [Sandaracinaceae bacterium]HBQ19086.1 hypothetical protein [Myxococcales bacterium]